MQHTQNPRREIARWCSVDTYSLRSRRTDTAWAGDSLCRGLRTSGLLWLARSCTAAVSLLATPYAGIRKNPQGSE